MKKTILAALPAFLLYACLQAQSCLPDGIVFYNQAQVDSFPINYPGCAQIEGTLSIGSLAQASDIHDLTPLSAITRVGGGVTIIANDSLETLTGLGSLVEVGGVLNIAYNNLLTNFEGLSGLTSVGIYLQITGNGLLTDLSGLDNLNDVQGIYVQQNPSLLTLNGLQQIDTLANLTLLENNALANLFGIHHLRKVDNLLIESNLVLGSLAGLEDLSSLGVLQIQNNSALADITALSGITSLGTTNIRNNLSLASLAGLENVRAINYVNTQGGLSIGLNPRLQNLAPLANLRYIHNGLQIYGQDSLINLAGLDSLVHFDGGLRIVDCANLESLHGLEQIDSITGQLYISGNPRLTSLAALSNITYTSEDLICFIKDNPILGQCAIDAICSLLAQNPVQFMLENNAPGCNTLFELEQSCNAREIDALVVIDTDGDCEAGAEDIPIQNIHVQLSSTNQQVLRETELDGIARFGYFDIGPLVLSLPQFPTASWVACQDSIWVNPDTSSSNPLQTVFLLQALDNCPKTTVELGLPPYFRGCLVTSDVQVAIHNSGGVPAEGVQAALIIPDALMEVVSSTPPISSHTGDTLFYELGDLGVLQSSNINVTLRTRCDTFLLGQTICLSATISKENECAENPEPYSQITIEPQCKGDTLVSFTLKNIGNAPTQSPHEYVIIEDEVVLNSEFFDLEPQETLEIAQPATGATYRLEATQFDNGQLTSAAVENCGGLTPGLITAYWLDQDLENYDFDCRIVSQAYDPNQKTAVPTGVGDEHLLAANRLIDYTIEFQNTGTDTAFRVQLLDKLSSHLDIRTFQPGFSSHPYTWEIRGTDSLEVLFFPIALPDSLTNETASKGFFSYAIHQKPNLPDGTLIENTAAIVFDFNPPIVTNTVFHTIGQLVVKIDEPQIYRRLWQVMGNPTRTSAVFAALEPISGEKQFRLIDANGRLLRTDRFAGQEYILDRGNLPGGVYFFQIIDKKGRSFTGKLLVAE